MSANNLPNTPGAHTLVDVLESGLTPQTLDQVYDVLKLMGIVLGHATLLEVATNSAAKDTDRVNAAKVLATVKDSPEDIAERLKRSQYASLSVDQLRSIVRQLESGERDLTSLLVKESTDAPQNQ